MRGLLLAGGHGTRLRPLTFTGNKHMIPIANQPMLFYGLHHLADVGIRDVAIILGPISEGIQDAIGDGSTFGLRVTYITQGAPKGLAHAVLCARDFLGDEPFVMYLGDNLLQQGVEPLLRRFEAGAVDAVVGVTPVERPSDYGVVELDGDRIVSIVEKPAASKSNLALIGVYLFTPAIYPVIESLRPSPRGELEITEAIWNLHLRGGRVAVQRVEGWWKDAGQPESLLEVNAMVLRTRPPAYFTVTGTVEPGAVLTGPVRLEAGARISAGAHVTGPTIIGAGARIESGSRIGAGNSIGDRCIIRGAELHRSILMEGVELDGPIVVSDSIIGRSAIIRATEQKGLHVSCVLGDSTQLRF